MTRANGEGSIYQRADGRWVAQYKPRGGRDRRYRYARSEAAAVNALRDLIREADAYLRPTMRTFESFANEWLEHKAMTRRGATYATYDGQMRNHILPAIGKVRLRELQTADIMRLHARMRKNKAGTNTIVKAHHLVHNILKDAQRSGEVVRNVADLVQPPPRKHYEPTILTLSQARRLLDKARGTPLEAFWWLGIQGMRNGEICALRWECVDLVAKVVRVESSIRRIRGGYEVNEPKTKRSIRVVKLAAPTVEALQRRARIQLEEQLKAGPEWQDLGFVFTRPNGTPVMQTGSLYWFRQVLKSADVPVELQKMRVHDLRHSFVSLLLAAGMDVATVSATLGHTSPAVTMRVYAHMIPDMDTRAADTLSGLLGHHVVRIEP